MINFQYILQDSEAVSAYLYANTPNYLYHKLRNNLLIVELAATYSTTELINDLEYYLNREKKSFNDLLIIHAIIIATTFKDYNEVKDLLAQIHLFPIKWAKELEKVVLQNQQSNVVYNSSDLSEGQATFSSEHPILSYD